jgi:hypothetical protein
MNIKYIPTQNMLEIVFDDGKENIIVTEDGAFNFHIVNNSHLPTDEKLIGFVSLLFLDKKNDYERKVYEETKDED